MGNAISSPTMMWLASKRGKRILLWLASTQADGSCCREMLITRSEQPGRPVGEAPGHSCVQRTRDSPLLDVGFVDNAADRCWREIMDRSSQLEKPTRKAKAAVASCWFRPRVFFRWNQPTAGTQRGQKSPANKLLQLSDSQSHYRTPLCRARKASHSEIAVSCCRPPLSSQSSRHQS